MVCDIPPIIVYLEYFIVTWVNVWLLRRQFINSMSEMNQIDSTVLDIKDLPYETGLKGVKGK